jgi:hypothetical protein
LASTFEDNFRVNAINPLYLIQLVLAGMIEQAVERSST